ncbi:MAG: MBL fold metallo-hydrolase, partial [Candidatus Bathyarchaeia archaeon]
MDGTIMEFEKIGWMNGVTIATKDVKLVFDPVKSRRIKEDEHVFISHAHSDHTYGFYSKSKKYSTIETKKIYEAIKGKNVLNYNELKIGKRLRIDDVEIIPLNAGHMLGSTQFKIFLPEKTIVYTGDINCVDTLTSKAADEVDCDELIIEATYGDPYFIFPDRERIYAKIVDWTMEQIKRNRVPTFHVYAAGKAQEIIKLFDLYTKLKVVLHPLTSKVCKVYSESGIKLNCEDFKSSFFDFPCVHVTTLSTSLFSRAKTVNALATGWALKFPVDKSINAFPLSSHADFEQLLQFVKRTKAKTVYTFVGFKETFASILERRLNVVAKPLPIITQKPLYD